MNIALLGPQGSGKGTQGEMLSKKLGMYYFDAGEYFREIAKSQPALDEIINKRGALLPDDVVYKLVRDHFIKRTQFDNIIFDGYPRSLSQWNLLKEFLKSHGASVSKVFFLSLPESETIKRLSARRMDPVTHHIYNLITNPPPPGVDLATLIHREDDKPEAIAERLLGYKQSTVPLLDELRREGFLIEIDGTKDINTIFSEITEKIASI